MASYLTAQEHGGDWTKRKASGPGEHPGGPCWISQVRLGREQGSGIKIIVLKIASHCLILMGQPCPFPILFTCGLHNALEAWK